MILEVCDVQLVRQDYNKRRFATLMGNFNELFGDSYTDLKTVEWVSRREKCKLLWSMEESRLKTVVVQVLCNGKCVGELEVYYATETPWLKVFIF